MATIQEIQAVEYEMLQYVHKRCEQLGIRYCIVAGTLLGAIRHQGFIPWDDDVDVYMSMDDFEVFKKGFKSDRFFLQMPENEKEFPSIVCKLRRNGTLMKLPQHESLDIHHGICLDIFVYTDAGNNALTRKLQVLFRNVLQSFRLKYLYKRTRPERKLHAFLCRLPFSFNLCVDRMLYRTIKLLGSKKSSDYFSLDVCERMFFRKSFFDDTVLYPFEDGVFWGIREYDEYLCDFYGPDYMTPKKWGHVDDYSTVKL